MKVVRLADYEGKSTRRVRDHRASVLGFWYQTVPHRLVMAAYGRTACADRKLGLLQRDNNGGHGLED